MADTIRVEVVHALPDRQRLIALDVAPGTTMLEAARQSGIAGQVEGLVLETAPMGIFGKAEPEPARRVLEDGERVEIYRPLTVDPKAARRARAERARKGR
ncbi:RnfH family protein [Alloalcanivorax gelatiniphagus]|uniref:RnfH family protein n=1 Tax=Alloalcanivorax gelatiniphagus TaxID=1194167 RepID=UPI00197AC718|nr:RnfH family protein [Alloalcanivorax gelatiniphagus]